MLKPSFFLFLALLVSSQAVVAATKPAKPAPLTPRKAIQMAYEKSSTAMGLRYVEGLYSDRAPDFVGRSPEGKVIDQRGERASMTRLVNESLAIKETVDILTFSEKSRSTVECTVHDVTELLMAERGHKRRRVVIDSSSKDLWALVDGRWKLKASTLIHQSSTSKELGGGAESPSPSPSATPAKAK